jgi:hypothetical protein
MTAARSADAPDDDDDIIELAVPTRSARRLPQLPASLNLGSPAWTWAGIVVAAAGFVLIGIAWGQVAGETQVYLQLPYLVSAGLTGLGLIMVGVTAINVTAKRRDAEDRERQMDQLVAVLEEVKDALGQRGRRR